MAVTKKISIASYGFHGLAGEGRMNVFGYLESCRYRYGMRSADIWNGMMTGVEEDYLKKLKAELDERELELANLCVDGPNLWDDDPANRDKNYQDALKYLKAAEILGARTIRIDAGGRTTSFTNEQFDFIVKRYKEYAKRAADGGYRIGPENHWGPEVDPATMRKICESVDHPGFGVLVHFKNKCEEEFAKWAMHTHISWDIAIGPLEKCMKTLVDAGYQGYWSVEHHSGHDEYQEVAIQVAKVRQVLSRW